MPKGHVQETCSFRGGQEAGSEIGRAQEHEITFKASCTHRDLLPSTLSTFLTAHSAMSSSMDQSIN